MAKRKFNFEYGIDEKGRRYIVMKLRGRYLIFRDTSKFLKFLMKNNATERQVNKALDYVDSVFRAREEEFARVVYERNLKRKIDYIG